MGRQHTLRIKSTDTKVRTYERIFVVLACSANFSPVHCGGHYTLFWDGLYVISMSWLYGGHCTLFEVIHIKCTSWLCYPCVTNYGENCALLEVYLMCTSWLYFLCGVNYGGHCALFEVHLMCTSWLYFLCGVNYGGHCALFEVHLLCTSWLYSLCVVNYGGHCTLFGVYLICTSWLYSRLHAADFHICSSSSRNRPIALVNIVTNLSLRCQVWTCSKSCIRNTR
jgi:hypothetical protein